MISFQVEYLKKDSIYKSNETKSKLIFVKTFRILYEVLPNNGQMVPSTSLVNLAHVTNYELQRKLPQNLGYTSYTKAAISFRS